ncbi:MAG: hypothetical protein ACJARZ_002027 [Dokdonia sp.]|jgi:hypothetical protein
MKHIKTVLTLCLISISLNSFATIHYVAVDGTGTGSTWADASGDLQAMIDASAAGDTVWVRGGTYLPNRYPTGSTGGTTSRDYAFILKNQVKVFGGFSGNETNLSQRTVSVVANNSSILSGDIGIPNDNSDNCYHVIFSAYNDANTTLDGFTIEKAFNNQNTWSLNLAGPYASSQYMHFGAGILIYNSSVILNHILLSENNNGVGAGLAIINSTNVLIKNSIFSNNHSTRSGGAAASYYSSSTIINSIFSDNTSTENGGAIFTAAGALNLINTTISKNESESKGGAINIETNSSLTLKNSIIWGNTSANGINGISDNGFTTQIENSDIQDNYNITGNNKSIDPLFQNSANPVGPDGLWYTADDGLRLISCTNSLVEGGESSANILSEDITGLPRIQSLEIDMGPYELQEIGFASINSNSPLCLGVTGLALNSSGGVTYDWKGPNGFESTEESPTIPNTNQGVLGIYAVIVTDEEGCKEKYETNIESSFSATASNNSPLCLIYDDFLELNASSGVSYQWTGPAGFNSTIQNPSRRANSTNYVGTYQVIVANEQGCTAAANTEVNLIAYWLNTAGSQLVCPGDNVPLGFSNLYVGQSPIADLTKTYSWTGPNDFISNEEFITVNNVSQANAGAYNFTVTDNYGCSGNRSVTTNVSPIPNISGNTTLCRGDDLNLSSSTLQTYSWSGPNGFTSDLQNPQILNVSSTKAGVYSVTGLNSDYCQVTNTILVIVNENPTVDFTNKPTCVGQTLTLTGTGDFENYSWVGPESYIGSGKTVSLNEVTSLQSGSYTLTILDINGCVTTANKTISLGESIPPVVASSNNPVCYLGTLNLFSNEFISYQWTGPNGFESILQNPSLSNVTGTANGTYQVEATAENGCKATSSTEIDIIVPTISSNSPVCEESLLNLFSSEGTSHSWTGPNEFTSSEQNPSIPAIGLEAVGEYTLVITDANSCVSTLSTAVTVNDLPTITLEENAVVCMGSTLNLNVSGGISYAWTGPEGFSSSEQNPVLTNLSFNQAGRYYVTVTNEYQCSKLDSIDITVSPLPEPEITTNAPYCFQNPINFTVTGGDTYLWSGPKGFTSTSATPSIPAPYVSNSGVYSVTATSLAGCSASANTNVVVNYFPSVTTNGSTGICEGNTFNLSATGGTSYSWNGPNDFTSSSQNPIIPNVTINDAGRYYVDVTANGCTTTGYYKDISAYQDILPQAKIISIPDIQYVCEFNSIELTTEVQNANFYSWSGPNGFTSTQPSPRLFSVTQAQDQGYYTLTVNNFYGCSATATSIISVFLAPPVPTVTGNTTICQDETLSLNIQNNYGAPFWTTPSGDILSQDYDLIIDDLPLGNNSYRVEYITGNGCQSFDPAYVTVNVKEPAVISSISNTSPVCVGQAFNILSTGSAGTYGWTGPDFFEANTAGRTIFGATAAKAGQYNLTLTASNGCVATANTIVTVDTPPSAPTITKPEILSVCEPGSLTISATCPAGELKWSDNSTEPSITVSDVGVYNYYAVCVTNSCPPPASATVRLEIFGIPVAEASSNTPVCIGSDLNLTATGGSNYLWSGPNGFTSEEQNPILENIDQNAAGTYSVVVTTDGCSSSTTTEVTTKNKPTPPNLTEPLVSEVCFGNTLTLSGTCASGTIKWSNTSEESSLVLSEIGVYELSAICIENGCESEGAVANRLEILALPTAPDLTVKSNAIVCQPDSLIISGTCASGTILWSDNSTGDSLVLRSVGVYTPSATCILNGCLSESISAAELEINELVLSPTITAKTALTVCAPDSVIIKGVCPSGLITWSDGSLIDSVVIKTVGTYDITATCSTDDCISLPSEIITAEVKAKPAVPIIETPAVSSVCFQNTITLQSTCSSGSVVWYDESTEPNLIISAVGIYDVTATCVENGCTSEESETIQVEIKALPTISINSNSPICIGTDINLESDGGDSYRWTGSNDFTSELQNPTISNASTLEVGTYKVTVTKNGCEAPASTTVNLLPLAPAPILTAPELLTVGYPTTLTFTASCSVGTVVWFNDASGNEIILSEVRSYSVTALCNDNGCLSAVSTPIAAEILSKPASPSVSVPEVTTVCSPEKITLTATCTNGSVVWSDGTELGPLVLSVADTYSITAVCRGEGVDSDPSEAVELVIKAQPSPPTIEIKADKLSVCAPETVTLTATCTTGTVLWSDDITTATRIFSEVGIYDLTAVCTLNGCSSENSLLLNVHVKSTADVPTIVEPEVLNVCSPNTITLTGSCNSETSVLIWQSSQFSPSFTVSEVGEYNVFAHCIRDNGCNSPQIGPITLKIQEVTATASADAQFCKGRTLNLSSAGGSGYNWTGPDSFTSLLQNPSIQNAQESAAGKYTVTVQNEIGCSSTASVDVTFQENQARVYVKQNASGSSNGSTWENAYTSFQSALEATCFDSIWVASGTYLPSKDLLRNPNPIDPREKTFFLPSNKVILGSFAGTETDFSQRTKAVIDANPSTLSGDLGTPNDYSDNSYHVVMVINETEAALFDGFTIVGGNANGVGNLVIGPATISRKFGGAYMSANSAGRIENCTFSDNKAIYAAGFYNHYGRQSIINCSFTNNAADSTGGGIFNFYSSPSISQSTFMNNSAPKFGGGGIGNFASSPTIDKCIFESNTGYQGAAIGNIGDPNSNTKSNAKISNSFFISNSATFAAGAVGNVFSDPIIDNCVFSGNGAQAGGAIANSSASPKINNSTFYNNSSFAGGAIYNKDFGTSPKIRNSIFYGNKKFFSTANAGADIENASSTTATVDYSILQFASASYPISFIGTKTGNLYAQNPAFINAGTPKGADNTYWTEDDGLNISAGSPAINTGTSENVLDKDILGNPRPFLATISIADMGAYEYQSISKPTVASSNKSSICLGESVTLSASCPEGVVTWYSQATEGTALSTGLNYSPTPTENVQYFASCILDGTESNLLSIPEITVNAIPDAPEATASQSFCNANQLSSLSVTGSNLLWFDALTLGNALDETTQFQNEITYYVTQTVNGCQSTRGSITTIISPQADPVIVASQLSINAGESVTLTASSCSGTISWEPIDAPSNVLSTALEATTTFTATCTSGSCTSSVSVTIEVLNIQNPCETIVNLLLDADDFSNGTIDRTANSSIGRINASNRLTGTAKATYSAKSIELKPGFKADSGTVFLAKTGGCN